MASSSFESTKSMQITFLIINTLLKIRVPKGNFCSNAIEEPLFLRVLSNLLTDTPIYSKNVKVITQMRSKLCQHKELFDSRTRLLLPQALCVCFCIVLCKCVCVHVCAWSNIGHLSPYAIVPVACWFSIAVLSARHTAAVVSLSRTESIKHVKPPQT